MRVVLNVVSHCRLYTVRLYYYLFILKCVQRKIVCFGFAIWKCNEMPCVQDTERQQSIAMTTTTTITTRRSIHTSEKERQREVNDEKQIQMKWNEMKTNKRTDDQSEASTHRLCVLCVCITFQVQIYEFVFRIRISVANTCSNLLHLFPSILIVTYIVHNWLPNIEANKYISCVELCVFFHCYYLSLFFVRLFRSFLNKWASNMSLSPLYHTLV